MGNPKPVFSLIWGFTIVSSAFFARSLYNTIISVVPRFYIGIFVAAVLLSTLTFVTCKVSGFLKNRPRISTGMVLQLILSCGVLGVLFYSLDLPEEKIHILLYSSLGALRLFEIQDKNKIFQVAEFVFLFSLMSECLQGVIPGRFYDIRDIGIDTLSGAAGAALMGVILTCERRKEK